MQNLHFIRAEFFASPQDRRQRAETAGKTFIVAFRFKGAHWIERFDLGKHHFIKSQSRFSECNNETGLCWQQELHFFLATLWRELCPMLERHAAPQRAP